MSMQMLSNVASHSSLPFYPLEFDEPTAKAPLWRPYAPSGGATFQTICIVEARGLDFVGFEFSVSPSPRICSVK